MELAGSGIGKTRACAIARPDPAFRLRRGHPQDARKIAMYLVHRLCDLTLAETARRFGVTSYGTVAWACHQVGTRIATEGPWYRQVTRIEQAIAQQKT